MNWRISLHILLPFAKSKDNGFTLLEILIALFVFTIVSVILVTALHRVIDAQTVTENKALKLRQLQMTFLTISRDIEQIVNRPITDATGKEEGAFVGSPHHFFFTHGGYAKPMQFLRDSSLQRAGYFFYENSLWRKTFSVLDQAPQSQAKSRVLLSNLKNANFAYLDNQGEFHDSWASEARAQDPLPRAIRIQLTISQWGKISQLYVIPAEPSNATRRPPKS
jgi:general secretion pathway protein J